MTPQPGSVPDSELEQLLEIARERREGALEEFLRAIEPDVRQILSSRFAAPEAETALQYVRETFSKNLAKLPPTRARLASYVRVIADDMEAWPLVRAARQGDSDAFTRLASLVTKRIRGAAVAICGNQPEMVDEVVNDVLLRLHRQLPNLQPTAGFLGSWLRVVARNRAIDSIRRQEGKTEAPPRATPEDAMEQLALLLDEGTVPWPYAISFALQHYLRTSPEEIMRKWLDKTFSEIADALEPHWKASTPLRVAEPDRGASLGQFLPVGEQPAAVVARWIQSASNLAEASAQLRWMSKPEPAELPAGAVTRSHLPPPRVYEELLRITLSGINPTHETIAFGFNKLLAPDAKYTPARMSSELGDDPLSALAEKLDTEYRTVSGLDAARVAELFAPLRQDTEPGTVRGDSSLRSYESEAGLARDIPHWADAVRKRTRRVVLEHEGRALAKVFSGPEAPYEKLAFGLTRLAGYSAAELAAKRSDANLNSLLELLRDELSKRSMLGRAALDERSAELAAELAKRPAGGAFQFGYTCLRDYYDGDPAASIAAWRDKVTRRLLHSPDQGEKEVVFWIICGFLS
jgi:DNA-directed RNA polymerase specialized sigma24 family protein